MAATRKLEETLAKLLAAVTAVRAKEPPDQQPVVTPTRSWSFLPSVTQAPLGLVPENLPRLRLEPPRFDGENASDWIHKIQKYYNHHYTPLDDRLYLTKYLFDQPAAGWREYWEENNKGKGWDAFLLAVKQRFDPDLYDDYVGRLATLRQTSTLEAYQTLFESLLQKTSHIEDSMLSYLFITGLKSPLKQVLLMRRPSTLKETFAIVQKLDQRKPNRTKIQEAIDDGEGIPKAPSPAAPSTATAARANQPMDGVGTMILTVDEEILDEDDERKLGGNSSCDGGHSDNVAHVVSDPDKGVTSESLLLEATAVFCSIEPASFDASVETHKPSAEPINAENFIGDMDACFVDIEVVTECFKDQQAVPTIGQLLNEVSSLDVVVKDKEIYFGEVKVPSSEDQTLIQARVKMKVYASLAERSHRASSGIVSGGGISGTVAACTLQNVYFKVILLESKYITSERIHTDYSFVCPLDMGASWVHGVCDENNLLSHVIRRLGLVKYGTSGDHDLESYALFETNGQQVLQSLVTDVGVTFQIIHKLMFDHVFWVSVEFLGVVANTSYSCGYFLNLNKATGHPVLVYMAAVAFANNLEKPPDEAVADFVRVQLSRMFLDATEHVKYLISRWGMDPNIRGCYLYDAVGNSDDIYDWLRASVDHQGSVHGACSTETIWKHSSTLRLEDKAISKGGRVDRGSESATIKDIDQATDEGDREEIAAQENGSAGLDEEDPVHADDELPRPNSKDDELSDELPRPNSKDDELSDELPRPHSKEATSRPRRNAGRPARFKDFVME